MEKTIRISLLKNGDITLWKKEINIECLACIMWCSSTVEEHFSNDFWGCDMDDVKQYYSYYKNNKVKASECWQEAWENDKHGWYDGYPQQLDNLKDIKKVITDYYKLKYNITVSFIIETYKHGRDIHPAMAA